MPKGRHVINQESLRLGAGVPLDCMGLSRPNFSGPLPRIRYSMRKALSYWGLIKIIHALRAWDEYISLN